MALNSEQDQTKLGRTSRRQWLAAIASMFGFGVSAIALARFLQSDAPQYTHTVRLGKLDDLVVRGSQRTVNADGTTLVVVRPAVEPAYAMLMECTHAGCPLALEKNKIRCGCHGGVFDIQGRPESGPPKKPLTRIPLSVIDDTVFVRTGGRREV